MCRLCDIDKPTYKYSCNAIKLLDGGCNKWQITLIARYGMKLLYKHSGGEVNEVAVERITIDLIV